jgi:hypothetical protein
MSRRALQAAFLECSCTDGAGRFGPAAKTVARRAAGEIARARRRRRSASGPGAGSALRASCAKRGRDRGRPLRRPGLDATVGLGSGSRRSSRSPGLGLVHTFVVLKSGTACASPICHAVGRSRRDIPGAAVAGLLPAPAAGRALSAVPVRSARANQPYGTATPGFWPGRTAGGDFRNRHQEDEMTRTSRLLGQFGRTGNDCGRSCQ